MADATGFDDLDPAAVLADAHRPVGGRAVDETHVLTLSGVPQVVSIRGRDRANPVMVVVHGGPGSAMAGSAWLWQRPVEELVTVVHHDQRGAGRSYRLTDEDVVRPTMTLQTYVDDLVELLEWITGHLGVERVVLLGHSWGSVLAVLAAASRPDLVGVYVGAGQVVSMREGEHVGWTWALHEAARRGDDAAVAGLESLRPYPGDPVGFAERLLAQRRWVLRLGGSAADREDADFYGHAYVLAPGHSRADLESADAGNAFTVQVMLPSLLEVDLSDVTELAVPVVQVLGRHDRVTPPELVERWLRSLTAPDKVSTWFEHSGHFAMYEEPGRFLFLLRDVVLPAMAKAVAGGEARTSGGPCFPHRGESSRQAIHPAQVREHDD